MGAVCGIGSDSSEVVVEPLLLPSHANSCFSGGSKEKTVRPGSMCDVNVSVLPTYSRCLSLF